jgi:hypothetical protein
MKWKNILLTSLLTIGLSGLANLDVQAAVTKNNKDTTPPATPIFKVNKYINLSNVGSFEIKGKGEANSIVLISLKDSKTTLSLSSKADSKGNFKVKANTKNLVEGSIIFTIQNVDKAGNKSKLKTMNLLKDLTIEDLSIDNEGFINALTQGEYPVSGTADFGSKIDVSIQSGKTIISGLGTVDELGNYSVDIDTVSLPDGIVTITVKQSDIAGNVEQQSVEVVKETNAPNSPIMFSAPVLQSETVTNYFVSGLGVKNGEVEVTLTDGLNDVSSIATVDENGLFQVEFNAASLQDGEITITAKQMSEAGNESLETIIKTKKDTAAPAKPVFEPLAVITTANQAEYSITGQGEKGTTVQVLITDGTTILTGLGLVDDSGKFVTKINVTSLKVGNVIIIANQTDSNKNVGLNATAIVIKQ